MCQFSIWEVYEWVMFLLGLVYEWGGVRGLQPHIRTQNHGKLPPPPPCKLHVKFERANANEATLLKYTYVLETVEMHGQDQ